MAGHSKWANIKHRKSANDAKKSKHFAKLVKEITIAAKQGGISPEHNARLRLAIRNAQNANLPKNNIERALKKGSGEDAMHYTEVTYEGYAAHGVAVMVECMTDNLNRTLAAVRALFSKNSGSLGKSGSLMFLFARKGLFTLRKEPTIDEETLTLTMIEAGAETIEKQAEHVCITCPFAAFGKVQQALEAMSFSIENATLRYVPTTSVYLQQDAANSVMKLIDALEDHDDVQQVFHNMVA